MIYNLRSPDEIIDSITKLEERRKELEQEYEDKQDILSRQLNVLRAELALVIVI
jgi:hypothetical protein